MIYSTKRYQHLVKSAKALSIKEQQVIKNTAKGLKNNATGASRLLFANFLFDIDDHQPIQRGGVESAIECVQMLIELPSDKSSIEIPSDKSSIEIPSNDEILNMALTDAREEYDYLTTKQWQQVINHFKN